MPFAPVKRGSEIELESGGSPLKSAGSWPILNTTLPEALRTYASAQTGHGPRAQICVSNPGT
jgi:hypothetical protein